MRPDPTETLAAELHSRGLAAPARLLLDAHRPLRPLLAQTAVVLGPILGSLLGGRAATLQKTLDEPEAYDRLVDRLRDEP